jgi:CheY-like chemotaxis protein
MKSILVVDDNPLNSSLAGAILGRAGFSVHTVDSGEQALDLLVGVRVDAILTDISMPGMSGKELARILRARMGAKCPRLVAYTAFALPHQQQSIVEAGFDAIVVKPAKAAILLAALAGSGAALDTHENLQS